MIGSQSYQNVFRLFQTAIMAGRSRSYERGGDEDASGKFLAELRLEHAKRKRRGRLEVVMNGSGFVGEVVRQIGYAREAVRMSEERVAGLGKAMARSDDQIARVVARKAAQQAEQVMEQEALLELRKKLEVMEKMVGDTTEGLKMDLDELCECREGCTCVLEVQVTMVTKEGEVRTVKLAPSQLSQAVEEEEAAVKDWSEEMEEEEEKISVASRMTVNAEVVSHSVVQETHLQVKGATGQVEMTKNKQVAECNEEVKVVVTQNSPLVRGGSGDGQSVQDEVSELQMRSEEGANRLALVEHYELMKRYAAAGLWTDVEATAGKVAVAWKALIRRGGEATVDRMLLRVRFESR